MIQIDDCGNHFILKKWIFAKIVYHFKLLFTPCWILQTVICTGDDLSFISGGEAFPHEITAGNCGIGLRIHGSDCSSSKLRWRYHVYTYCRLASLLHRFSRQCYLQHDARILSFHIYTCNSNCFIATMFQNIVFFLSVTQDTVSSISPNINFHFFKLRNHLTVIILKHKREHMIRTITFYRLINIDNAIKEQDNVERVLA